MKKEKKKKQFILYSLINKLLKIKKKIFKTKLKKIKIRKNLKKLKKKWKINIKKHYIYIYICNYSYISRLYFVLYIYLFLLFV